MNANRTHALIGLACLGLSLVCALKVIREEARRRACEADRRRELQDWESEGGALATQPQVPGAPPSTTSSAAAASS